MVIYICGTGPEADLLTLRGVNVIENADAIVFTKVSNIRDILRLVKNKKCEFIDAERQEKETQKKLVIESLTSLTTRYSHVVRLIHGDPLSSPEGSAEIEYLALREIPFEVIPGVSPLLSSLSMAGIPPISTKNHDFAIVRVSDDAKKIPSFKKYPQFVAIASGTKTKEIARQYFKEAKISKNQTVAVIRNYGSLDQLTEVVEVQELDDMTIWPHDLIIVASDIEKSIEISWFETKRASMKGQRVGYLWPGERTSRSAKLLENLGAEETDVPLVDGEPVPVRLPTLERFDAFVFPNAEIVQTFFNRLEKEIPQNKLFFAIGPEAQFELEKLGFSSEIPISYTPRGLSRLILSTMKSRGRILIVTNDDSPEILRESLSSAHIVWEINLYKIIPLTDLPDLNSCTALVVDSYSVIQPLSEQWNSLREDMIVISSGPTITRALFEKGMKATVESKDPSAVGYIYSLMNYVYRTP